MSDKYSGMDFSSRPYAQPQEPASRPSNRLGGLIFTLVIIGALAFIAYKVFDQFERDSAGTNDSAPTLADIDNRLTDMEARLEKLEAARRATVSVGRRGEARVPADDDAPQARLAPRTVYQVTPAPSLSRRASQSSPAPSGTVDAATQQRLSALQQGVGAAQTDAASNREALQATNNKLNDISGQVGSQSVQILQSQDELNQLLARTEMEAIPFELSKGPNPVPVGPVSLVLKTANAKTQRYTLCVYIQPSCIQLRDRTLHEVVQFVTSRNTAPLEVIATKVMKDQVVGYLEVPRHQVSH